MVLACLWVGRNNHFDKIYATSTPLTVGLPAMLAKKLFGTPYVFEVRDLWPEFPIQVGAIKSKKVAAILRWLERKIYKNALEIVALSPGMRDGVIRVSPNSKVSVIPNMSKPKEFRLEIDKDRLAQKYGVSARSFKLVYFGTMGVANNIMHLLSEARFSLESGFNFQFVLVGDGAVELEAKKYAEKYRLHNVFFLGRRNMAEVVEIVNLCDVSLVSFLSLPILETNSPNKFFDTLSAAKPTLINIDGWIRDLVEEHECGYFVDPNISGAIVDKMSLYANDQSRYCLHSDNAFELATSQFDREFLCGRVVELL